MTTLSVSLEQWRKLYDAMERYHDLAPWQWLWDSALFGVRNPADGTVGYCCVMGRNGTFFGLGVYPGAAGLDSYDLMRDQGEREPETALYGQRCLMASFDSRADLEPEDLAVVKALGRKYRGEFGWPKFRDFTPGLFPWFLEPADVAFLTVALEQATEVGARARDDEDLLSAYGPSSRPGQSCLVRVRGDDGAWRDEKQPFAPATKKKAEPVPVDEARVAGLLKKHRTRGGSFEGDLTYMPTPIKEDGRPFFPRLGLWVDAATGMVLPSDLARPGEPDEAAFVRAFWMLLEKKKKIPRRILVKREHLAVALMPLADKLGIEVVLMPRIPQLEDCLRELTTMTQNQPDSSNRW